MAPGLGFLFLAAALFFELPGAQAAESCEGLHHTPAGRILSWPARTDSIRIGVSNQIGIGDAQLALGRAAETWNRALARRVFVIESVQGVTQAVPDDVNLLTLVRGPRPEGSQDLALTRLDFEGESIVEADIVLFPDELLYSNYPRADEVDLEQVLLHELGHVLGFDHSSDPESVMFPRIRKGPQPRTLSHSDLALLRCLM